MIKKVLKKLIPKTTLSKYSKFRIDMRNAKIINDGYALDSEKFKSYSASFDLDSKEKLQSYLIKEYHAVEKGLALPAPRIGFGVARIRKLIVNLNFYIDQYGIDEVATDTIAVLEEYKTFDTENNPNENPIIKEVNSIVTKFNDLATSNLAGGGGTKVINKSEIEKAVDFDFEFFFKSRHSIRDFSEVPVDIAEVEAAVDLAKFTPSVCNRQAWKAYIVKPENTALKEKLLSNQNGNKGFGERISSLIVVTGKLSHFFAYERNQVFIDGGMFAMSIVLALHSKGLGTCCLNLSYTAERNKIFDGLMDFDADTVPIMYIAVGNLKDSFRVANSNRKEKQEILRLY
ncbi:nitroreductase family protein [Leeuwenhoekiella marinoflava]|uniref:Nitroreductase n=2 Tax=Leeuwenhoekiella marinoflava TaxID=988 RepID=A0A4Q0PG68_9FLAO|nr:nitroreductase family protein [Leeuwenhoekiella marinoflava]RXG25990.1 nitroreductase [Leeuwenhoekiella marinoflava]SHF75187.1 Nitroreductase [Leeuwenhoekiella marinoflava DSM 3653]